MVLVGALISAGFTSRKNNKLNSLPSYKTFFFLSFFLS